jgi:hypothetical protein
MLAIRMYLANYEEVFLDWVSSIITKMDNYTVNKGGLLN